jgi:hypothetical protein
MNSGYFSHPSLPSAPTFIRKRTITIFQGLGPGLGPGKKIFVRHYYSKEIHSRGFHTKEKSCHRYCTYCTIPRYCCVCYADEKKEREPIIKGQNLHDFFDSCDSAMEGCVCACSETTLLSWLRIFPFPSFPRVPMHSATPRCM